MQSIFISTAHKNQDDEQIGTGDVDYAHTLAERLKELYQRSQCDEKVDCIQHLHDESAIYKYIEEKNPKNPILHIMLNPPYTGSAFTLDGLMKFKQRTNCKIIITSIEFAKYDFSLKSQAFSYFNIADHVIFLDDKDKEQAEKFSKLNSTCNTSVIPVPATIPNILGLNPAEERGNNILFFGMIRKAKGIGYLLQLAELIKTNRENNIGSTSDIIHDIKIIIVGSIQEHIYDNIFQLKRIILAMYPEQEEHIEQLININGRLSSEEIKNIIQRLKREVKSYEEQNLPKALPIELYLDVPKDQLAVPFNKCKFSVLPLWRGGSIRNSSMTNMLVHDFITISFNGSATPEILIKGEYNGAMILLPQKNAEGKDVFANNVFDTLKSRLETPTLNNATYDKMRYLSKNVLSIEIIIQKHVDIYSCLRDCIAVTDTAINKDKISELDYYKPVYSKYGIQFIKTIRSDEADYYDKFVGAILGKHKEPTRKEKTAKQIYKVGIRNKEVQILKADEAGKFLPPQFSGKEKQGKSKKTSLTVISSKQQYLTGLFGQNKEGRTTGIIFFTESGGESEVDKQIILPSLIFKNDAGTVGRTFYFESEEMAQNYIQNKGLHVTVQQLINAQLEIGSTGYNEVLSRLQWLPNDPRCHIGIFSKDLTSKLLAQLRAIDLKINTNANYIPITFYDSNNKDSPFSGYLLEERQADVEAGLLFSAENEEANIIKSMALLIKKYEESQLSKDIVLNDEEREKCLTVLINFKFTKTTLIKFIKLICAIDDVNINICAVLDQLLKLVNNNQKINPNLVKYLLEEIENINDENVIKKLFCLFNKTSSNNQEKISFLEKILNKITDLNVAVIEQLMQATYSFSSEDTKLNYLEKILNKITNLNVAVIEQLIQATYSFRSKDTKLNYLEKILNKITNLNVAVIEKLVQTTYSFSSEDTQLNYLEKILNKITDLNVAVIEQLIQAIYSFSSEDTKLNYLEKILNKITNLNVDVIEKLVQATHSFSSEDTQLNYLEQILNKITDLNVAVIEQVIQANYSFSSEDTKLNYLEQILNKITNLNVDVIEKLVQATHSFSSEDTQLNYLEQILNKITDLNVDVIEKLVQATYSFSSEDTKLNYLEKILNKTTNLNVGVIEKLVQATYSFQRGDNTLKFLEQILDKLKLTDIDDDNSIKLFIYCLYQLKVELEHKMKLLNKFKLPAILKVIKTIKEQELKTITDDRTQQQLHDFLDTISINLTTRKRAHSPSLVLFPSSSTKDNIEYTTHEQPPEKKMKHDYT